MRPCCKRMGSLNGALDYVVNGKMIGRFALVANPAEYRNSCVMTFLVSRNGTVFQKDLGSHTAKLVQRMLVSKSVSPVRTNRRFCLLPNADGVRMGQLTLS